MEEKMIKLDVLKYKKIAFLFSILFIVAGLIKESTLVQDILRHFKSHL